LRWPAPHSTRLAVAHYPPKSLVFFFSARLPWLMDKQHQIKRTLEQPDSIESIREFLGRSGQAHRTALSDAVCRHFGFFDSRGATQVAGCVKALRELERASTA